MLHKIQSSGQVELVERCLRNPAVFSREAPGEAASFNDFLSQQTFFLSYYILEYRK
jgi:hypothetical protein